MSIRGFQIKNNDGKIWNDRSPHLVLDQATAMVDFAEACNKDPENRFHLVPIVGDDVDEPDFTTDGKTLEMQIAECLHKATSISLDGGKSHSTILWREPSAFELHKDDDRPDCLQTLNEHKQTIDINFNEVYDAALQGKLKMHQIFNIECHFLK